MTVTAHKNGRRDSQEPRMAGAIRLIQISRIKYAPWNPPNRIEEKKLKRLYRSVLDIGMIYPIVVDKHMNLVDGHRRVTVAKMLGWITIAAIVLDVPHEHAYGSIQDNQQKLSGNDILGVWLKNKNALIHTQRGKVDRLAQTCGIQIVTALYRAGKTAGCLSIAQQLVGYCNGQLEIKFVMSWLLKYNSFNWVSRWIEAELDPEKIRKACLEGHPVKLKLTAEN